jgi:hypothetical protein
VESGQSERYFVSRVEAISKALPWVEEPPPARYEAAMGKLLDGRHRDA